MTVTRFKQTHHRKVCVSVTIGTSRPSVVRLKVSLESFSRFCFFGVLLLS